MKWFSENSLDGLAEGVNESILAVAAAAGAALEEAYQNLQGLEERLHALEKDAVSIRHGEDGMLEILPAGAGTNTTNGKEGADEQDGAG